jgi:hypothetical protein
LLRCEGDDSMSVNDVKGLPSPWDCRVIPEYIASVDRVERFHLLRLLPSYLLFGCWVVQDECDLLNRAVGQLSGLRSIDDALTNNRAVDIQFRWSKPMSSCNCFGS